MIRFKSRYFLLLTLSLFIGHFSLAQDDFESGFNFGLKVGGSKLLGEMTSGFSETINEFNNQFGIASGIEISKYLSPHIEIGMQFGYSVLNGNSDDPLLFSAQGFHAAFPPPPDQVVDPVEYQNKLLGQNFFFRYYLGNVTNQSYFNPFISGGVGYLTYKSVFQYSDTKEIIFGKGNEEYTSLSTAVFFAGAGFKTKVSSQFYLLTSVDFNLVNYDFLDVVHNYDEQGDRTVLNGLYTEIKIGIFYTTKAASGGGKSSGKKGKSSRSKSKPGNNSNLPFSR